MEIGMYKDSIFHLLIGITHKTEQEALFTSYLVQALIGDRRFLDGLAAALRLFEMEPNAPRTHERLGYAYLSLVMLDLA